MGSERDTAEEALGPVDLQDRAADNLRYIRKTMERAGSFTAVPGWGAVVMGLTAIGAAVIAARQPTSGKWLLVWLAEAALAVVIEAWAMKVKARRAGISLVAGPARLLWRGFLPPVLAGVVVTAALLRAGQTEPVPGMWLLLYGVAVITGGAFSIRIVPLMGGCFIVLGTLALFTPAAWGDTWPAVGFGALHIIFGGVIARRHGG